MGYSLLPKKKGIESIDIGVFSWPMFLQETGAGFVIGYGQGMEPGSYVYQSNNIGSPVSNDGYTVTAFEAKAMAKCIRGYVTVSAFINQELESLYPDEKERESMKNFVNPATKTKLYNVPFGQKRLEELDKIADFMEKSGGFSIH